MARRSLDPSSPTQTAFPDSVYQIQANPDSLVYIPAPSKEIQLSYPEIVSILSELGILHFPEEYITEPSSKQEGLICRIPLETFRQRSIPPNPNTRSTILRQLQDFNLKPGPTVSINTSEIFNLARDLNVDSIIIREETNETTDSNQDLLTLGNIRHLLSTCLKPFIFNLAAQMQWMPRDKATVLIQQTEDTIVNKYGPLLKSDLYDLLNGTFFDPTRVDRFFGDFTIVPDELIQGIYNNERFSSNEAQDKAYKLMIMQTLILFSKIINQELIKEAKSSKLSEEAFQEKQRNYRSLVINNFHNIVAQILSMGIFNVNFANSFSNIDFTEIIEENIILNTHPVLNPGGFRQPNLNDSYYTIDLSRAKGETLDNLQNVLTSPSMQKVYSIEQRKLIVKNELHYRMQIKATPDSVMYFPDGSAKVIEYKSSTKIYKENPDAAELYAFTYMLAVASKILNSANGYGFKSEDTAFIINDQSLEDPLLFEIISQMIEFYMVDLKTGETLKFLENLSQEKFYALLNKLRTIQGTLIHLNDYFSDNPAKVAQFFSEYNGLFNSYEM